MALTKVTYSMIYGAVINVLDYGAVGDGITDDTVAIQTALNTKKSVYLPAGTYLVSSTLKVYPKQTFFGDGIEQTIITSSASGSAGYQNYTPIVAACDTNGSISLTTKSITDNVFVENLTIKNTGMYSIGLLYAGVFPGGVRNVSVYGDNSIVAGSRTSLGVVLTGLNKGVPRGMYYTFVENLYIDSQKIGFIYGNRANSNGAIQNLEIYNSDVGLRQDDGSDFSFDAANLATPATMVLNHPNIEVIDGNAIDNIISPRTSVYAGYFDTIGGNVFDIQGGQLQVTHPYFSGVTGNNYNLVSGNIKGVGNTGLDVSGYVTRTRDATAALQIPGYFDNSGAITSMSNPVLITGTTTITGTGTNTASSTVTFSDYTNLETTLYVPVIWLQIVSTSTGGTNNALYNTAYSGLSSPDTSFLITVKTIDGSTFSENVVVRWFGIAYTP